MNEPATTSIKSIRGVLKFLTALCFATIGELVCFLWSLFAGNGAILPTREHSVAYRMLFGEQYQAIPYSASPSMTSKAPLAYEEEKWTTNIEQIRGLLKQKQQRKLTCEQLATKAMEVERKEKQLVAKKQELKFKETQMSDEEEWGWQEIKVENKSDIDKWKVEHEVQDWEWEWVKLEIEKDELNRLLKNIIHFAFLWPLNSKKKAIGFLLVFSLATLVALLQALRSGWGPPLELALSLSNDNYWVVFVDVFADLLAFVWSNPATQYTLCTPLGVAFTISLIMNGFFLYNKIVSSDSTTQNSSFHDCHKLLLSQEEQCKAVTSRWELHQALAQVGDWYGLCLGLEISDSISQPLRHSSRDVTDKKRVCLDAFYDLGEGEACWERVVRVVAGYPIHKKGLAKKLAKRFGIDFEDTVESHSEL